MKLNVKTRQKPLGPHVLRSPNQRAGISPVTVRRLMADLEYNYYQERKALASHLPERGPVR